MKEEKWFEIKNTKKKGKSEIKTKVWVKGKAGLKFYKQRLKHIKEMTQLLKPEVYYTSDYDIFSINWGNKPVESTIETKLGETDVRFDVTKNGTIVGIEIEDLSGVLKTFDCDKNAKFKKETERRYKQWQKNKPLGIKK